MRNIFYILIIACTFLSTESKAQPDEGTEQASAVLHVDPRVNILIQKHNTRPRGAIYSAHGYRVQIYSGSDRNKAMSIKVDFMRRFPNVRTYMTYVSPHFRVKVGDYKSRQDAVKMYQQVSTLYNPCMIVPDIVVINTLKND